MHHLTDDVYNELVKPSVNKSVILFSDVEKDLFHKIVDKYMYPTKHRYYERISFWKTDFRCASPRLVHDWGDCFYCIMMIIAIAIYLTKTKRWGWLWHEWLTSTDPKKIGTMYMIFASLMFFRGMLDAGMVWLQQSIAADSQGYLTADHFQQIFTSHGDIMVFFVTMGFFFGLMNWIVPLQIGARDLAFPFLNSFGFWLTVAGGILINFFFIIGGDFANTGWLAHCSLLRA